MEAQQNKREFFHKLGYSKEEVCRVLAKLGHEASDNDLLQELIQMEGRPQEDENEMQCFHSTSFVPGGYGALPLPQSSVADTSEPSNNLRPIVIDGSNVAMSHGNKEVFSCLGIQLVVDWFKQRGHQYIKVFVPSWRKEPSRFNTPITEHHLLENLAKQAILVYTPSRKIKGKRMTCYDDRYIVKLAYEQDGVIVSNDNFRDLQNENPEWKWFIEQRLLMYSFVNDKFMPPDDPLGRHGPSLGNFLSKKPLFPESRWQLCPYGKKCTYGIKCKFYHPERMIWDHLSVADELRAKAKTNSLGQRTEEEKMGTNTTKNKSGQTSALCTARSATASRSSTAVGSKIFRTHNTPQDLLGSADNWSDIFQGHRQSPFTLLEDQRGYADTVSIPVTAPPWTARTYSGNTLPSPADYKDLLDDPYYLSYSQSPPVSRHNLCLNCPCLEVCNFQGCCRKWIPAVQTSQTPSFLARQDSTVSSAESFSYGKPGDTQYLGSQPFLLNSGLLRAEDCYVHPSGMMSWPNLAPNPLSKEQANLQHPLCFGFPYSQEGQVSAFSSSDSKRNFIASAQRCGSLQRRLPNRKPL